MNQQLSSPSHAPGISDFSASYTEYLNKYPTPVVLHVVKATAITHIDDTGLFRTLCSPNLLLSELHLCGCSLILLNVCSLQQK